MTVHFLMMGDINSLTGGNLYNKHMAEGLEHMGYSVNIFGTDWNWKIQSELEKISRYHFEKLVQRSCILVDSLVLASLHNVIPEFADRLTFIGLIHLPTSFNIHNAHKTLADEELQALQYMSRVIVTGQFSYDLLWQAGLNRSAICLVEPGTDDFPRKSHYKRVPSNLLCIANFSPLKAQHVLVRSLHGLTEWEWTLHLYGDTDHDREYSASVISLVKKLCLEDRVILHGIVERDEISAVFLDADLFIMPSLFETYGMALTESLAHGIPVVTTRGGNIPSTVPEGMGILTEPGNEEQLASAIRSLIEDPAKYSSLCRAASGYYLRVRSWEQAVAEFELILREEL